MSLCPHTASSGSSWADGPRLQTCSGTGLLPGKLASCSLSAPLGCPGPGTARTEEPQLAPGACQIRSPVHSPSLEGLGTGRLC